MRRLPRTGCAYCGKELLTQRQTYCGPSCSGAYNRMRYRTTGAPKKAKRAPILHMSFAARDALLDAAGNKCAICGAAPSSRKLHIDHCHTTGLLRGVLCHNCNIGLGNFRDSPDLLVAAVAYLKRSRQ